MRRKWFTLLAIVVPCLLLVVLELAATGCTQEAVDRGWEKGPESDQAQRSKSRSEPHSMGVAGIQDNLPDMHIMEWLFAAGVYTPDGYTTGSATGSPLFPLLQEHGYLAIKVPHPPPTYTGKIVRTGAYSPTANFHYRTYPTGTLMSNDVPLEFRDDLTPTVESKYPSGEHAHWEVLWTEQGYQWVEPLEPVNWPEVRLEYYFDFGGTPCWGCTFEYLFCIGPICYGPFPELIAVGAGDALVAFDRWHHETGEVVTPSVCFTKTHDLCNLDSVTTTYDLTYSSSRNWSYAVYAEGGDAPPTSTVTIGPAPSWGGECKYVELAATTTETDTIDIVVITATSQLTPEVYATTWNMVSTPWYMPEVGYRIYLPVVLRNF